MPIRIPNCPNEIAAGLPAVPEAEVRDVLAYLGPDPLRALSVLTQAAGCIVAERVAQDTRPVILRGLGVALARASAVRAEAAGRA